MVITPNKWVMRFMVASATAMVIIGIYGIMSQGIRSYWMAFYTAGNFMIDGNIFKGKRGKKAAMEPAPPVRSPSAALDEAATFGGGTHASTAHMMGQ